MTAQEYHRWFIQTIGEVASIVKSELTFREIDEYECYLKAVLTFATGHTLHISEYVILDSAGAERLKYRYQLLDANNVHLARWDNAPHHSGTESFPYHRHNATGSIHPSRVMTLLDVVISSLAIIENDIR